MGKGAPMDKGFLELWSTVLEDCGMEQIPHAKLTRLALRSGTAEMAFLLAEATRIGGEWQACRARGVSDDVSDELWRMTASLDEIFRKRGAAAARFLLEELQQRGSPHRPAAARLLAALAGHADRAELDRLVAGETDPTVREELGKLLAAPPLRHRRWWRFWERG